jgi:hypothetical protein
MTRVNCRAFFSRAIVTSLLFPLVVVHTLGHQIRISGAQARQQQEDDIREAVLRKQMLEWARGGDKGESEAKTKTEKGIAHYLNFRTLYVSVGKKDPSDDFLKRFADIPRIVKKRSEAVVSKEERMPVVDKKTHERGIIFYVDSIRWLSDVSVEVEGGYHCDGLCGAGITFRLGLADGKWVVKDERMKWIS